jgi:hypothetical protein
MLNPQAFKHTYRHAQAYFLYMLHIVEISSNYMIYETGKGTLDSTVRILIDYSLNGLYCGM